LSYALICLIVFVILKAGYFIKFLILMQGKILLT